MRYRAYPSYKPSNVECLGEIPEHWGASRLKFVAAIIMGQSPSSEFFNLDPENRPFLQGNAEFGDRFPTAKWFCNEVSKHVPVGALLLSVRAPVGALNEADRAYGIGRGLCALVEKLPELEKPFAWYSLQHSRIELHANATGSTYDAISAVDVGNIIVALPPPGEQRDITQFLDAQTAKLDSLVAKKRTLIEKLKEKRTALISRTVTRGLPPDAARAAGLDPRAKLKPSVIKWLEDVPAHWNLMRLRFVSPHITVGIVVEPSKYYEDEGVPCLRSLNVQPNNLIARDLVFISPSSNRLLAKSIVRKGDLVAVRSGQPGTTAVINDRFDGANCIDLIIIRKPKSGDPAFLSYFLNSEPAQAQFFGGAGGAIQQHFNIAAAGDLWVLQPPAEEQRAIVAFLNCETRKIDNMAAKVEAAIERLQEYRAALITAAVTGKIDVRGAAA